MTNPISYLICREDGTRVISGVFDADDYTQRSRFAKRAAEAWKDGHAVITKAETKHV